MNGEIELCRHGWPVAVICEDCIIEGDPDAPEPQGILNAAPEPIDWAEMRRLKTAELRRWEKSGHPGSKTPMNRPAITAKRKRERQARKAGRR